MDYSLLVCIHDCTIPPDSDDEDFNDWEEDVNGYISSDDIGEPPQSPHSPGEMINLHVYIISSAVVVKAFRKVVFKLLIDLHRE